MRVLFTFCLFLGLCTMSAATHAQRATDGLTVALPNRPTAQASAYIIKEVLASRLNVNVNLRPLGSLGTFVGIDSGSIHVHPQIWLPSLASLVERYADEKGTLQLSQTGVAAAQNICVTKQTADSTGIESVDQLADPSMARRFDSDGDGFGEIWIGARTWTSTKIERIRARSYGYDETMQLLQMPEDVAMASVDAAEAVGRPFVFYCQQPHYVFHLHEIVILKEAVHNPSMWSIVLPADDPEWLTKSTALSEWDTSYLHIGFATELKVKYPEVVTFLTNISFTQNDVTTMGYALEVDRQLPEDFARSWVAQNADRISGWIK